MADRFEEARLLMQLAGKDDIAFRILLDHPEVSLGIAIFHGQQAVEKALKAVLSAHRIVFPPTHNLSLLAGLVTSVGLQLPIAAAALDRLNPYAVTVRYDDRDIHTLTRDAALAIVAPILSWASTHIPIEPQP